METALSLPSPPGIAPGTGNRAEASGVSHYRRIGLSDPAFWLFALDITGSAVIVMLATIACTGTAAPPLPVVNSFGVFTLAWLAGAQMAGLYGRATMFGSLRVQVQRALTVLALSLFAVLTLEAVAGVLPRPPRGPALAAAAAVAAWIMATRLGWRQFWHHLLEAGFRVDRVLVLAGTPAAARMLAARLTTESNGTIGIAGCAALPEAGDNAALSWLEATARSGAIDRVVLAADGAIIPRVNLALARLARLAIDVSVLPDVAGLQAPVLKVDRVGMLPAIELDFRPLSPLQMRVKRLEDCVLSSLALVLTAPVMLVIAAAIKLDSPGPILFRQLRAGFNDRAFHVWKFRTMRADAADPHATRQTSRQDRRVTRVGRLLRRTSLDELPQLFNVLAGQMSIVGPRPHALGMTSDGATLHEVIEDYSSRHRLKPGITGWAQVNGSRGEIRTHEQLRRRVGLDCYYIENWSLRLDLWIVARTAAKLLFDDNAY